MIFSSESSFHYFYHRFHQITFSITFLITFLVILYYHLFEHLSCHLSFFILVMSSSSGSPGPSTSSTSSHGLAYHVVQSFSVPPPNGSRWDLRMRTFAIEPGHPFVSLWNSAMEQLTMSFVRTIPTWASVDVLKRGFWESPDNCIPSIIITLLPGSLDHRIIGMVNQLWHKYRHPNIIFNIEILEGLVERYTAQDLFQAPPNIGKSIGLKASSASGTSGGYLQLKKPGKADKICALTCHHVVAPELQGR